MRTPLAESSRPPARIRQTAPQPIVEPLFQAGSQGSMTDYMLCPGTNSLLEFAAAAAVAASRILRQHMYDVQLRGALALVRGSIAEMQTGEGKTLAAVPAIAWLPLNGRAYM